MLVGCALAILAVKLAYDQRIAAIFVAAAAVVFVLLRLVAVLLMAIARRLPRPRSPVVRLAIANIHRPGALTPSVVLSLGLGLALLVTVVEIDGNLRRQFMAALPDKAPSFYFVDIAAAEAEKFDAFIRERAPRGSARPRADAARPHRGGQRHPGRADQAAAGRRLGAAERPRRHLCGRPPRRARGWWRANGGSPIIKARRWSRSRNASRTDSGSRSATP